MGTAYDSRNDSSNNIADGNVINAADLDGEFDAILAAFGTGGHSHDGTAGEGGAIEKIGPSQQFLTDSTTFYPSADDTADLGKTGNQWKDIYIDGKAYIDGLGEDILVDTAFKVQFRDSDIYINSGADGELDLAKLQIESNLSMSKELLSQLAASKNLDKAVKSILDKMTSL